MSNVTKVSIFKAIYILIYGEVNICNREKESRIQALGDIYDKIRYE